MATGQSLWVGASDDLVLDAQGARLADSAKWATNSTDPLDIRTGLVFNGATQLLTGTAGLSVNVAPHHFLSSKGSANGVYQGVNKTTTAVTVPAAPALGNKRIDLLWVTQTDKHATISADASTAGAYGVVTGTPTSGTPSKPALPAGATEVGTITWDSTSVVATATNAAQCTLATTGPWTVTRGAPIPVRNTTERGALTPFLAMRCLRLDKGGLEQTYDGTTWRGQRRFVAEFTSVDINRSDATGIQANIAHGAPFTPAGALLSPHAIALQWRVFNLTSTTFDIQVINSDGSANGTSTFDFTAEFIEALT